MSNTILVVDDEPQIVEICRDYLTLAGYTVVTANDGLKGLAAARQAPPDLIVLDLMLPGLSGWEVARQLRRDSNLPIIILTARASEPDRLAGLELGADDYLTKPFSPRELAARVRMVLRRRHRPRAATDLIQAGDLTLDRGRYLVIVAGREISLTRTEFEILATLTAQPGRIFSRAQLLNIARGVAFEGYERVVDTHILNLRRKIEPPGDEPHYLVTVHGVGYKFMV